jgi:diguanylate cyclase (GGDEF)-like protein
MRRFRFPMSIVLDRSNAAVTRLHQGSSVRRLYLGALAVVVVGFALFALHTWQTTKAHYASLLAQASEHLKQGVEATLRHQQGMLYVIAGQLDRLQAIDDPQSGRELVERAMAMNPVLAGFGLARPDGQLVLVSGVERDNPLPNLLDREVSRDGFLAALDSSDMVIGRTYYFPLLEQWLLPVRLAYRNAAGEPVLVMTAGVVLNAPEALWNSVDLPPGAEAIVWRDDGYRQLVLPTPAGREAFYADRFPMPADWMTLAGPGIRHASQTGAMSHATRDAGFSTTSVVTLSWETLVDDFLGRMAIPALVSLGGLLLGWLSYGYAQSSQRRYENALLHQATHDPLTELPNRSLVEDRLHQDIARAERRGHSVAVMYVDLDQFKRINDSFGHRTGDRLLKACADRLAGDLRAGDTVGRLGGDEFLLVFPDLRDATQAPAMAARVLDQFGEAFYLGGTELFSTASVGVAVFPHDGEDAETLMQNADAALYQAKDSGRNSFCFFEPGQNQATQRRIALEHGLRRAVEREELRVVYQPQCDTRTLQSVGAEALLRWNSSELGEVSPGEFIPVAEESGLIDELGWFVLETVMRDARTVQAELPGLRFAVNVSVRQFRRPDFIHELLERLKRSGVSPRLIELEVTESIMAESIPQLALLRDAGLRLAIDDFGTGFSCLSYLKRLPVTTLKLDREFIRDLETDQADRTLVTAMVAVARELRLETVAEGVETEGQLALLRLQGCSQVQGYLTGRPMALEQLVGHINNGHPAIRAQAAS